MAISAAILLVDDDEDDFLITKGIIRDIKDRAYTIDWISSYEQGLQEILADRHDVYLVDYLLGVRSGLELIKEAIAGGCQKPIILLTGQGTMQIDEQAMEAGAYDFLEKGSMNPHLLERAIRYSIRHARDISEIRKLNTDLERRVQERTHALAGVIKELQEANKNLLKAKEDVSRSLAKEKELNELKSRFVSTASHEFRTPLSTILSSVNLIGKYNKPENQDKRERHIQRIQSAVNNLQEILNDFLSLGKLEEGRVRNNPALFDIVDFSESIYEEMHGLAKKDQNIVYHHLGERRMVFLDKQLLRNTLINIISNAIKYSSQGKEILFTTKCNDSQLSVLVKDEGIGIPEEEQPFIFERFYRARNSTDIQGTGLGLNIARKYTQLMGGTISFESQTNTGTSFKIEIPI